MKLDDMKAVVNCGFDLVLAEVAQLFPGGQALLELKSKIDTWKVNGKDVEALDALHDQFKELVLDVHRLHKKPQKDDFLRKDDEEKFEVAMQGWRITIRAMNKSWTWLQVMKSTHHRQQIETLKNEMMFWHLKFTKQIAQHVTDLDDRVEEHKETTKAEFQRVSLEAQTTRSEVQRLDQGFNKFKEDHKVERENHKEEVHGLIEEKICEGYQQIKADLDAKMRELEKLVNDQLMGKSPSVSQGTKNTQAPSLEHLTSQTEAINLNDQPKVEEPGLATEEQEEKNKEEEEPLTLDKLRAKFESGKTRLAFQADLGGSKFDELKCMEINLYDQMRGLIFKYAKQRLIDEALSSEKEINIARSEILDFTAEIKAQAQYTFQ